MSLKIISWNVRGLGTKEKRLAVKRLILSTRPGLLCIQESKLDSIRGVLLRELSG